MSDYCTYSEALTLLPTFGTLTASTVPTTTQAAAYPTLISNELNLHLTAAGVDLPVTDGTALAALGSLCQCGVAALLLKARFPGDAGPGSDAGGAGFFETRYRAGLALIDGGALSATAAPETSDFGEGFTTQLDVDGAEYETTVAPFWRLMEF